MGREILVGLLADESVAAVHALVRRRLAMEHVKLTQHVVDFAALPPLPHADEAYCALGTTIKVAGSQAAFRAVDHDAVLAFSNAAISSGAMKLGVVSAMGANLRSSVFYSRVKGETEVALGALGAQTLVLARPSLLVGERQAVGQPERPGERWGLALSRWLGALIPRNYRPIPAHDVARALLNSVPYLSGTHILASGAMLRR